MGRGGAAASAPDGTVTLLFSDIENSSPLNERYGDEGWLELLRAHNTIVRAQVDEHGGYEVKSQGDGFMIAFPTARQAVICATDIRRALMRRAARGEFPIRVRIGIQTGEAIRQQGDFFGKRRPRRQDRRSRRGRRNPDLVARRAARRSLGGTFPSTSPAWPSSRGSADDTSYSGWLGRSRNSRATTRPFGSTGE